MLNDLNRDSWTGTAMRNAFKTTCATIKETGGKKKRYLHNWVAESERIKKRWWERQTRVYSSHPLDSPFERDCSSRQVLRDGTGGGRKKKPERNAVASSARNRTLPNAEEGGRSRTRERITGGRTPTTPARTTECCVLHKDRCKSAVFRNLSAGIDVRHRAIWYDRTGDSREPLQLNMSRSRRLHCSQ